MATGLRAGIFGADHGTSVGAGQSLTVGSVAIAPPGLSTTVAGFVAASALATMSDNSLIDVTSTAAWLSANPLVATASVLGLVVAVALGDTTVSATLQGKQGVMTVHVGLT